MYSCVGGVTTMYDSSKYSDGLNELRSNVEYAQPPVHYTK